MTNAKKGRAALVLLALGVQTAFLPLEALALPVNNQPFVIPGQGGTDSWQPATTLQNMPQLTNPLQEMNNGASSIKWPTDSISFDQLQQMFAKVPGLNKLNIQFPNQGNWSVTPEMALNLYNSYQQEAGSVGLQGKLPELLFSSLSGALLKNQKEGQGFQMPVLDASKGDIKEQLDDMLRQLRYQTMNMGDMLPDWLKRGLLAFYDAVYAALNFMGAQLAALF